MNEINEPIESSKCCYAYSFPFTFNIKKLFQQLKNELEMQRHDDTLHFRYLNGDVFIFQYGSLVSWGIDLQDIKQLLPRFAEFAKENIGAEDDDVYEFDCNGEKGSIIDDYISLPDDKLFTKLAFSYGLAQSVKLGGFEVITQNIISLTSPIPKQLADNGKVNLSRKEIHKMIGRLFLDRNLINLQLDFLGTPDFFWEQTDLEYLHEIAINYLDIRRRVEIINQRFSLMNEMFDVLSSELNSQHSTRLEWIIIILILIEVIVIFAKDIFKLI